jgi:hypothetical protein
MLDYLNIFRYLHLLITLCVNYPLSISSDIFFLM